MPKRPDMQIDLDTIYQVTITTERSASLTNDGRVRMEMKLE